MMMMTLCIVQSLRDYTVSAMEPDYCFLACVADMAKKKKTSEKTL